MILRDAPPFILLDIESAVQRAYDYGFLSDLANLIEYGAIEDWQNLFNNQDARKVISQALRGKPWRYSGARGTEKQKNDVRDMHVLELLYYLIGYGYTVKGEKHYYFKNKFLPESPCDIASRAVEKWGFNHIEPEQIYRYIWLRHKKEPSYKWYVKNDNIPAFNEFGKQGQADFEKDKREGSRSEPPIVPFKLDLSPNEDWPPLLFSK